MKDRLKLMERCLELVRLARRKGEPEEAKAALELEMEFGAECDRLRQEIERSAVRPNEKPGEVAA